MPEFSSSHCFVGFDAFVFARWSPIGTVVAVPAADTSNGSKSLPTGDVSSYFSKKMNPKKNKMRVSNNLIFIKIHFFIVMYVAPTSSGC